MNCRICKSEITNGALCNRCLKTANEELLTVEERRQRNDNINLKSTIFFILGYLLGIPGFFLLFFVTPLGVLMLFLELFFIYLLSLLRKIVYVPLASVEVL